MNDDSLEDITLQGIATTESDATTLQKPVIKSQHDYRTAMSDQSLNADYELITSIGRGAMSEVYLVMRKADKKLLVMKLLDKNNPIGDASIERFMIEAELLAGLSSPLVVKVFDQGITDHFAFIVMEFLSRGSLKQRVTSNNSIKLVFSYMIQIINGLNDIHNAGVVHRDIKPANIMFRSDDSLTLTDFGIAQKIDMAMDKDLTMGQVIGTPVYMSPEQGEGLKVDGRADIYSAGIIFYELLTQKKPFFSHQPLEVIEQHINDEMPSLPSHLNGFSEVVNKMTTKDPTNRFQSASEIMTALLALRDSSNIPNSLTA